MKKILLKDLLNFSSEQIEKVKVKFNQHNGDTNPMEEYIKNPEAINTGWLFWRKEKRYFNEGEIAICFFKLGKDTWVLSTIKLVTKELNKKNGINYEGEELDDYLEEDEDSDKFWVIDYYSIDKQYIPNKEHLKLLKDFVNALYKSEELLEEIFGNHVKVIGTKSGFRVEDYSDHD